MQKIKIRDGARAGAYSAVLTVIVIAAAIVVNLIINSFPSKYIKLDTTAQSMFTFDEKTENFIELLTQDVTVYHIAQEGAEDPYLSEVLDRYSDMNSHIKVEKVDPAKQPTFTEKYTEDAVSNNSLIIESADRSKVVPSSEVYYIYCEQLGGKVDSATFEYYYQMYYQYYGQALEGTQIFAGENAVASGIDYVTMEDIPNVYLLSGHDEPELNSELTEWLKLANYRTQKLTLTKESLELGGTTSELSSVPEDADLVIITGLSRDLSEGELSVLCDYVAGGGDLVVMSYYAMAGYQNFSRLAAAYGIDNNMSLVIEGDPASYSGSPIKIIAEPGEHEMVAGLTNIYMPYAHAMKLAPTMPENMKGTVLLSTSDKAFAKKTGFDTTDKNFATKQEGDTDGPFALGVLVECEGAGNVVWLASDYYMVQENYDGSGTGACDVFTSAVSGLCGIAETISVHTVEIGDSYLNVSESSASLWGVLLIGVIPIAFIGIGLFVWMRRRSN